MLRSLRLRWRFFWSRRSRGRVALALMFLLLAVGAGAYAFLPPDAQNAINGAVSTGLGDVGALDPRVALGGGAGLLVVIGLALIFAPGYRKHTYMPAAPSLIPPVSVYVDAENQLSTKSARAFTTFLMEHLDGRRADLLYFLDASHQANSAFYKELYRFGFRPVDVPHDPTGQGEVEQAVDREIAMHAYERGLLGPANQEFILVSADGDFVPLVYRLVALGHSVQIWAKQANSAYQTLATYLDVTVLDLDRVIAEASLVSDQTARSAISMTSDTSKRKRKRKAARKKPTAQWRPSHNREVIPVSLNIDGERELFLAIDETLQAHEFSRTYAKSAQSRNGKFHELLNGILNTRMARVGYRVGSWREFWLEHLLALRVFESDAQSIFPRRGPASAEEAARRVFVMAQAAARAVRVVASSNADGLVTMTEIADALVAHTPAHDMSLAEPLFQLMTAKRARRGTHARYFVRCARALGLIAFEDISGTYDKIRVPSADTMIVASSTTPLPTPMPFDETRAAPPAQQVTLEGNDPIACSDEH